MQSGGVLPLVIIRSTCSHALMLPDGEQVEEEEDDDEEDKEDDDDDDEAGRLQRTEDSVITML